MFFDSIDPHEATASGFPEAIAHAWSITAPIDATGSPIGVGGTPALKPGSVVQPAGPDLNGVSQALTLPIAIPPAQIPEIASVGLAFSPFAAGPGYASTLRRDRALWIELREPIENPARDTLFARVLAHGSDPLLHEADPTLYDVPPNSDVPPLPPLALDPELMRVVTPGESDNRAGIDAMTILEAATDSPLHFLLPLPPGIDPSDTDLFGFYTYELRIGHAGKPSDGLSWSTAQARFGRPSRMSGVQHPAPELRPAQAGRFGVEFEFPEFHFETFVRVTAPFATPTLNGQPLVTRYETPKTESFSSCMHKSFRPDGASNPQRPSAATSRSPKEGSDASAQSRQYRARNGWTRTVLLSRRREIEFPPPCSATMRSQSRPQRARPPGRQPAPVVVVGGTSFLRGVGGNLPIRDRRDPFNGPLAVSTAARTKHPIKTPILWT